MRTRSLLAGLGLLALTASQFLWVRPTNFRGFDEWLVLSMVSRGATDAPYAHRPLVHAPPYPAWWIAPDRLGPLLALHALYIAAAALLVFLLVRRVWPQSAPMAWLAAAFTIVWSPTDPTRVCSVQFLVFSGALFGIAAAHWLFLHAWSRGSIQLLSLAALSATFAALIHEAALPPLVLAAVWPFLAQADDARTGARRWRWVAAWALCLAPCVVWYAVGLAGGGQEVQYQMGHLKGEATLGTTAANLAARLSEHVLPLFANAVTASDATAVVIASVVLLLGLWASAGTGPRPATWRDGLRAAAVGAVWTLLAHVPFAISTSIQGPSRTQYLSAPGLGLVLAGLLAAAAALPWRGALAAALALSVWIVAQGTARTVGFQRYWDAHGSFPAQAGVLAELLRLAPSLRPDTLVILLGEQGATWKLELAFRHAVAYVYGKAVVASAPGAPPYLYTMRFEPDAVVDEPDQVIREPWQEPVRRFAYDQLVVVRTAPGGALTLLDAWPSDLPPLPAGARYTPRARIGEGPLTPGAALVLQNR